MTYKVWERKLKKGIKKLPKEERGRVVEYYREMYEDMKSGGRAEDSVLFEFGSPEKCAEQALSEQTPIRKKEGRIKGEKAGNGGKYSVAGFIGLVFFSLLVAFPLLIVAIAVLISFGAVSIAGGVAGIAGVVLAVYVPFSGISAAFVMSGVGVCIAAAGVGCLLFVAFFYATKGMAIGIVKALKAIYVRR